MSGSAALAGKLAQDVITHSIDLQGPKAAAPASQVRQLNCLNNPAIQDCLRKNRAVSFQQSLLASKWDWKTPTPMFKWQRYSSLREKAQDATLSE